MSGSVTFEKANLIISFIVLLISFIGLYFLLNDNEEKRNNDKNKSIEQKLQKLYYPLRKTLNKYDDISDKKLRDETYYSSIKIDLQEIIPYSYLSSDTLDEPFNCFISIFDKNAALMVEKSREQFDKQKKNGSEKIAMEIKFSIEVAECLIDKHKTVITIPTEDEAKKAKKLYFEILGIINDDISNYQSQIQID